MTLVALKPTNNLSLKNCIQYLLHLLKNKIHGRDIGQEVML